MPFGFNTDKHPWLLSVEFPTPPPLAHLLWPNSHGTRNAMRNAMQANGTCCCQWECSHCMQATSIPICVRVPIGRPVWIRPVNFFNCARFQTLKHSRGSSRETMISLKQLSVQTSACRRCLQKYLRKWNNRFQAVLDLLKCLWSCDASCRKLTGFLERLFCVRQRFPGRGQIQKYGVRDVVQVEPSNAHVALRSCHQVAQPVLLELLPRLLRPLLVELERVHVTSRRHGARQRMRQRSTSCSWTQRCVRCVKTVGGGGRSAGVPLLNDIFFCFGWEVGPWSFQPWCPQTCHS